MNYTLNCDCAYAIIIIDNHHCTNFNQIFTLIRHLLSTYSIIYRVSQKMVSERWRAIGHSIFNIQKQFLRRWKDQAFSF